jgi:uncharacterized protein
VVRRAYPVRTCVGCRKRAPSAELLRVVAREPGDLIGDIGDLIGEIIVVPDPAHRLPGRGAHLHFDLACFAQAVRRHAFGRALRVPGGTQFDAVETYLQDRARQQDRNTEHDR